MEEIFVIRKALVVPLTEMKNTISTKPIHVHFSYSALRSVSVTMVFRSVTILGRKSNVYSQACFGLDEVNNFRNPMNLCEL